jgi:hypothetical protein
MGTREIVFFFSCKECFNFFVFVTLTFFARHNERRKPGYAFCSLFRVPLVSVCNKKMYTHGNLHTNKFLSNTKNTPHKSQHPAVRHRASCIAPLTPPVLHATSATCHAMPPHLRRLATIQLFETRRARYPTCSRSAPHLRFLPSLSTSP